MTNHTQSMRKRAATFALALLVALPVSATAFPRPANALFGIGDIVFDPVAYAKDLGLDNIGWILAKTAVSSMTRSLVTWINSGFEGSPAFATDLKQNLLRVGDAVVAMTVSEIAGDVAQGLVMNSPYQDEIATAIRTGYYLSTGGSFYVRNPFTLGSYSQDPLAFLAGDFSQGGFPALHAAVTNCQNNPYCAYQLATQEVDSRLAAAGGQRITELNWGDGFLSFRGDCSPSGTYDEVAELSDVDNCLGKGIRTPGSVIASQLNQTLPKGMEGLITADEIDEVIGALFQQLINQVVGQTGLLGVSAPASGGGRPIIDRATDPDQAEPVNQIDPNVEVALSIYEANWTIVGNEADRALAKCPESSVARQALRDALIAQAEVDGARRGLATPGATVAMLDGLMPTDADVAASQTAASDANGSLKSQLEGISSSRSCPSN